MVTTISSGKCHVLTLGKFDNIRYTHRYSISQEKDLGVTIDDHISAKVKKTKSSVGLIRRTFSFLDCNLFERLYTTFVRPHLEYGQTVWSPHLKKHIFENVQNRATKLVDGVANLNYPERLKKLDLPTFVCRRARGNMIEVFKHIHTYDRQTMPHVVKTNHQLIIIKSKDGTRGLKTIGLPGHGTTFQEEWSTRATSTHSSADLEEVWKNVSSKYDPTSSSDEVPWCL